MDARAGLTLLEVLGAVALLAILYTVLAKNAVVGLRSEGESRRRLEASLIADERLAEIELELASGTTPPTGHAEEEREPFRIVTEVKPYELPPRPEPKSSERESLEAKRAAAARREVEDVPSLFTASRSGTPPALLEIDVAVRWEDGSYERELRRSTFALDASAVDAAFAAVADLQARRPQEQPGGEEGEAGPQQGQPGQQSGQPDGRVPSRRRRRTQDQGNPLVDAPGNLPTPAVEP